MYNLNPGVKLQVVIFLLHFIFFQDKQCCTAGLAGLLTPSLTKSPTAASASQLLTLLCKLSDLLLVLPGIPLHPHQGVPQLAQGESGTQDDGQYSKLNN